MFYPPTSQPVIVRLPDNLALPTTVIDAATQVHRAKIWLALPAVVREGVALTIRWVAAGVTTSAEGVVCASSRPYLALSIERASDGDDRRRDNRLTMLAPLKIVAERRSDGARWRGVIEDMSHGGVGLRFSGPLAIAAEDIVCIEISDGAANVATTIEVIARSVKYTDDDTIVGCAFARRTLAAMFISRLIGAA